MRRYPDSLPPRKKRPPATRYKVEQRQIVFRGRVFHFVSYDGLPARSDQPATAPAWFLMSMGTRWEVMPHLPEQNEQDVERGLITWLEGTIR